MFEKNKLFYETDGAVLKAEAYGFYKIKGLAAKSGWCRHVSCGATSPTSCYYRKSKAEHEERLKTGVYGFNSWNSGKQAYTPQLQAWAVQQLTLWAPQHPNCTDDWCVPLAGKARPTDLGQAVACSRQHLQPYTDIELADPKVRPESIAVKMEIAVTKSRNQDFHSAIALYDLIDDKWFNDKWWRRCGYANDNLMPHMRTDEWPAPRTLTNIDKVLASLKVSL